MFSIQNKTVIITGATGLVGRTLSKSFSALGAKLILVGRCPDKLSSLKDSINTSGAEIATLCVDFNEAGAAHLIIDYVNHNRILVDAVIHCAIVRPGQNDFENNKNSFESSIRINVNNSFQIWNEFAKHMCSKNSGSLIYIGSIYGRVSPDFSIYEGTKMGTEPDYVFIKEGMHGLSKYFANKYGGNNIRSNIITLGGVENGQDNSFTEKFIKKIPLGRMARTSDIVGPSVFLVSDASSYITGTEIIVDGGYLSR